MEKCFIPPGKKPAVELPGFDGGAEWGGPSYDPQTGLLYVNANEMGWVVTMRDVAPEPPRNKKIIGRQVYGFIKNIV